MEVVIFFKNEIIKLGNEVVIFEIVFGMVHGQAYKGFSKISHIPILIIYHWDLFKTLVTMVT
jgi:hypothetical protein